jgi:hypothetical protein
VLCASTSCSWRYTNTCRSHGYNTLGDAPLRRQPFLRSVMQAFVKEEVEKVGKVEYCGSISILQSLPNHRVDVCEVWFRSVHKCGFVLGTNIQIFFFIYNTSRGTPHCLGWPISKPDCKFVYYVTKKRRGRNKLRVSLKYAPCYVRKGPVLTKSTHMQEEEGSIVNEYNVMFYN